MLAASVLQFPARRDIRMTEFNVRNGDATAAVVYLSRTQNCVLPGISRRYLLRLLRGGWKGHANRALINELCTA